MPLKNAVYKWFGWGGVIVTEALIVSAYITLPVDMRFALPGVLIAAACLLLPPGFLFWIRWRAGRDPRVPEKERHLSYLLSLENEISRREARVRRRQRELEQSLMRRFELEGFPDPPKMTGADDFEGQRETDERIEALVVEKTDRIFRRLQQNEYMQDGVFQTEQVLEDLLDIVESTAKIHHPKSENPLMETNPDRIFRAAGRISLRFLVFFEELPLDVKGYSLKSMYDQIRTGAKAYGMYRSVAPFVPYLRSAFHLTRFGLGASPISLGAVWAVSDLARRGGKKLTGHLSRRFALHLLAEFVRIVAVESSEVFGGDSRYRNPEWIYGVELTALVSCLPGNPETLRGALNEVGKLRLNSEYDRIFLYRCLAGGKSGRPELFTQPAVLPMEQRYETARRLDDFYRRYGAGANTEAYKPAAEDRLGVRLVMDGETKGPSETDVVTDALRSLVGFLVEMKNMDPETAVRRAADTRTAGLLSEQTVSSIRERLLEDPPMIYDYPGIQPESQILDPFLEDLTTFAVEPPPYSPREFRGVMETARHLRRSNIQRFERELNRRYAKTFQQRLSEDSPEKRFSADLSRNLLFMLNPDETPIFAYTGVWYDPPSSGENKAAGSRRNRRIMLITMQRLLIAETENEKEGAGKPLLSVDKSSARTITVSRIPGRLADDLQLADSVAAVLPASVVLHGHPLVRFEDRFGPVLDFLSVPASQTM